MILLKTLPTIQRHMPPFNIKLAISKKGHPYLRGGKLLLCCGWLVEHSDLRPCGEPSWASPEPEKIYTSSPVHEAFRAVLFPHYLSVLLLTQSRGHLIRL